MISRREVIGKAAVGAAAALAVGAVGTGVAATRPLVGPADPSADSMGDQDGQHALASRTDSAPPPWDLLAPFAAGAVVAHGWRLVDLTPVRNGSAVATLQNDSERSHRIHLCRNDGSPRGLVYTRHVDLVVMNQGYGDLPTEEHFGQAVAELAHAVAANEAKMPAGFFAELLPHAERVERFAAVDGPSADGKLR